MPSLRSQQGCAGAFPLYLLSVAVRTVRIAVDFAGTVGVFVAKSARSKPAIGEPISEGTVSYAAISLLCGKPTVPNQGVGHGDGLLIQELRPS